jgi:hypothetical protein
MRTAEQLDRRLHDLHQRRIDEERPKKRTTGFF